MEETSPPGLTGAGMTIIDLIRRQLFMTLLMKNNHADGFCCQTTWWILFPVALLVPAGSLPLV